MATKVYNLAGGLYSGAAFSAFEGESHGQCVASKEALKVSAASGMNVKVDPGNALISDVALGYPIRVELTDTAATVSVAAANASQPRIDSIVAYVDKSVDVSNQVVDNINLGILKFKSVAGTPAATAQAPSAATIQSSIGAGNPYMILANITVPAGATTSSSFTIADTRTVGGQDALEKKVDVANIDLSNKTTTILAEAQKLAASGIAYARLGTIGDGATAGISDAPVAGKSFTAEVISNRYFGLADYSFEIICYPRDYDPRPFVAYMTNNTTALTWTRLLSVDSVELWKSRGIITAAVNLDTVGTRFSSSYKDGYYIYNPWSGSGGTTPPIKSMGMILVTSNEYECIQTIYFGTAIATRRYDSGTWTAWGIFRSNEPVVSNPDASTVATKDSSININYGTYFTSGRVATLNAVLQRSGGFASGTAYKVLTLTTANRPSRTYYAPCVFGSGNDVMTVTGSVRIATDGGVYLKQSSGSTHNIGNFHISWVLP